MTAVEWLEAKIKYRNIEPNQIIYYCKKAKEIEKQQIIDSHLNGQSVFDKGKFRTEVIRNAEQYYNEQFKNK